MTDTRRKRGTALNVGAPAPIVLPDADGSIDEADRAQLVHAYLVDGSTVLIPAPPPERIAHCALRSRIVRSRV